MMREAKAAMRCLHRDRADRWCILLAWVHQIEYPMLRPRSPCGHRGMGGPRCYTGYGGARGEDVRAIGKQGYDILKAGDPELTWRKQASADGTSRNRSRVAVAL